MSASVGAPASYLNAAGHLQSAFIYHLLTRNGGDVGQSATRRPLSQKSAEP